MNVGIILMINSFLKYLQFEKRYSQHTVISYRTDLVQFENFLQNSYPDIPITLVDHRMIRDWIIQLVNTGKTERSVNRKIASLRSFYKFLLKTIMDI